MGTPPSADPICMLDWRRYGVRAARPAHESGRKAPTPGRRTAESEKRSTARHGEGACNVAMTPRPRRGPR
jgi:hypothetical protein